MQQKNAVKELAKARRGEVLAFLENMVDVNSYSHNKKGIDKVGELVNSAMPDCFRREVDPQSEYGDNHIYRNISSERGRLLLGGHIDTLCPENTEFGVRMMHLTYNRRNLIGDGCAETSDCGLSGFGKKTIAEMNRVGIIPDVAHCGQRTSLEAALESKLPVVASHSVCHSLVDHCRAKKDEVIKAIAKSGGYIGMVILNDMIGGEGDINAFLNHIDYVAENFGPEHVAIGTDAPFKIASGHPMQIKTRKNFESYWPSSWGKYRVETDVDRNSLAWTNWPMFTLGMHIRGYSDEDIRKIIGLNVKRVCEQTMMVSEYCQLRTAEDV